MNVKEAVEDVLLGASIPQIKQAYRDDLLASFGLDSKSARPDTFVNETRAFVNKVCRELGDRFRGDSRVVQTLSAWAAQVEDYDVFDSLLSNFTRFENRERLVQRGRKLFAGPLTAHWED